MSQDKGIGVPTTFRLFCPIHRRIAKFELRDSGDLENPDLICPVCGYRVSYKDTRN